MLSKGSQFNDTFFIAIHNSVLCYKPRKQGRHPSLIYTSMRTELVLELWPLRESKEGFG